MERDSKYLFRILECFSTKKLRHLKLVYLKNKNKRLKRKKEEKLKVGNRHNNLLIFYFYINHVIHRADQYFLGPLITVIQHFKLVISFNPNFSI